MAAYHLDYWVGLCGNRTEEDAFWSDRLTWNTTDPDFTQCFQNSVLVWIPCGFLWLLSLIYIPYILRQQRVNKLSRPTTLLALKIIVYTFLVFLALADLIQAAVQNGSSASLPVVYFIKPVILFATYVLAIAVICLEFQSGIPSSGPIFIFWVLQGLINIVPFRSYIIHIEYTDDGSPVVDDSVRFTLFYIQYFLILCALILSCFGEEYREDDRTGEREPLLGQNSKEVTGSDTGAKPCPEKNATFISRILFFWITKLIINGYRRPLVFDDLWELLPDDTCAAVVPNVEDHFKKQSKDSGWRMIKKKGGRKERSSSSNGEAVYKEKPGKNGQQQGKEAYVPLQQGGASKKVIPPSIWNTIISVFGSYYVLGGFFKLVYDIISFINPQILNLLITFVGSGDPFEWRGYVYVVALFGVSLVRTLFLQQYWHCCFKTGMRIRTAIIGVVYRKSLVLNSTAKRVSTVGEIVNLMSVDAQKLQDAPGYLHMLWSAPLTVAVAMYFLWQQLGAATLAGLALMIMLVPVNALIAQKTRTLQIAQMKQKDARIKLMNEVLNGIKVLKLYAWEDSFRDRVRNIRQEELDTLKKMAYLNAGSAISWFMAPYLVALGSFGAYVLASPTNILDANKAFVSLSLFNLMNYPISILPGVIAFAVQANVSIKRINKFLRNEELDPDNVIQDPQVGDVIKISKGRFSWGDDQGSVLKNINLTVPEGKLVAVVGSVGCGKSSLISAMLGEMDVTGGKVHLRGSVAYVPQQAWIQNATLKDNILFGRTYHQSKYKRIIEACALKPDLEILPGGDMIEIGEKGINLSGGQKQRVAIARAVYQNNEVYLLDDPLSAVDSHVGKHIFENVIGPKGLLKNKTRILVTNGLTYLPQVDRIVVLKDNTISETGSYEELLQKDGAFAEFLTQYLVQTDMDEDNAELDDLRETLKRQISAISATSDTAGSASDKDPGPDVTGAARAPRLKRRTVAKKKSESEPPSTEEKMKKIKLIEEEIAETGNVKGSIVKSYVQAGSYTFWVIAVVFYLFYLAAQVATNIWLSDWSNDKPSVNGTQDFKQRDLRLGVYGGLGGMQALCVLGQSFLLALAQVSASRVLHRDLLAAILRAPMSFFDTTPLGRLVNRFSKDIDTIDFNIPLTTRIWMGTFSGVITTLFIISYSTPVFLAVLIPLGVFYYFVQRFYIVTSRQLKRIDSIRRSPIYAHFSETLSGTSSIRAYKASDKFIEHSDQLIDENNMAYYPNIVSNRWLGIYLEIIGNIIVFFAGLFAVVQRNSIDAGIAGLSVSYALQVTGSLNMFVRMTCDLETYIVAVERVKEYTHCQTEAATIVEGNRPDTDWPTQGHVTFKNYTTRYRSGLDLVLKGIDCSFRPGEKVGIVGRTGAGKSSLTLALFRIIEAAGGNIIIDDIDISKIGLKDLRSKLTIIPQDPVLFSGTLRMNLDPFDKYQDEAIWSSLEQSYLKSFVESLPDGLQHHCTEGGENLSVGQRQLVCLARALLRKTRILVLDEATAAVDLETDDLIQSTIRTEFADCSVITIAHRLNTIMDYDRIAVLDNGLVVEFASPTELLRNKNGIFFGMAKDAGLA